MQTLKASCSQSAVTVRPSRQASALRVRYVVPRVAKVSTTDIELKEKSDVELMPKPQRPQYTAEDATEDFQNATQNATDDIVSYVRDIWNQTPDAEKPAAVAIVVAVVVAQICIASTMGAVDRLPLIKQFLELVGLTVTSIYGYKYFTQPEERANVKENLNRFIDSVTGGRQTEPPAVSQARDDVKNNINIQ